ncbi:fimbrillin family protein [Bacteroides rodentium]
MKTKYLLAAMALPLFAACTQDEFMGQENESAASALQNRIKVGKVTLTGGEADTRINWETKRWEEGNVLGLFLMDETQYDNQTVVEEENNANKTFFMDQTNWNRMYSLSNYYNTNFPIKF